MRASLKELHDKLVAAVESLVDSDEWKAMLEVAAARPFWSRRAAWS